MDLKYPDMCDYKSIKLYRGKLHMGESSQPKIAQTMILMGNELISCINSSVESELSLSVSSTHSLDMVLSGTEIFLTRIHDGTSSFRRPWLDRSCGDASLGGPYALEGRALKY